MIAAEMLMEMMTLAPRYFLNPAGSGRSRYLTLV